MVHQVHEAEIETGGAGRQVGRLLATLVGVALLVVGAFLDWMPSRTGDKLTIKALVQTDLAGQGDLVKTVGGLSILIGLVALIGLVDRTGWITRLAGAASLVVFVMFAIEAFRFVGNHFNTAVSDVRLGAWLTLAAGIVLLIGGLFGSHVITGVPASIEQQRRVNADSTRA
jgi:hypothetical protein